jgi:autotransporter-associated beta strand protein
MRHPVIILIGLIGLAAGAHAAAEADLLVAYDNGYADSVGGDDNAEVLTANSIAASNAINANSGTSARMRIAGYHKTWWQADRSTLGGYVGWLSNYGDGNLDDVTAAADARGADLVAFICAPTSGETAAAVAQQPGRYAAYSLTSFWNNVVAHESGGHNYGCDHRGGRENPKTIMLHNYCGGGSQPYYSNPNIWLNGTKLLGEGSCLGAAVDGGDNAYLISRTAQGVADRNDRVIAAPNLTNVVRRWSFNKPAGNAPAGTTVTDAVSGTALATVQGSGAAFTGHGLRLPGGASGSGAAYLQLPGGVISGYTNVTVEIWATPLSAYNWSRVMDFNNGTSNYIMLSSCVGTNLNAQRLESVTGGTAVGLESGLPTATGVPHHYAITFQANGGGGVWTWYRDGDKVAFLDVTTPLSTLQDVNNWLGRSAWSGDALANCEYSEVRISNVAMTLDQVAANARLGPNRQSADVNLTANDAFGLTSFDATGSWSDGLAPAAGKTYETYGHVLRTPEDGVSRTFAGQSLKLSGGSLAWMGTSSSTTTINDFTLGGTDGEVLSAGFGTWTLAGNLKVEAPEVAVRAPYYPMNLSANISGVGTLLYLNKTVTLSGTNTAFTGKTIVGDGRFSGISIDSEARLGANPATFTADQLTLNRGILYNTGNVTIDDANRGIRIGESAGIFNVAPGTTFTLAVPLSSPSSGAALLTTPQYPNPVSGMLIKENTGTLTLTHPNNSYIGEIAINGGTLAVSGAGRLNNGDHHMSLVNNGTLLVDTSANQSIGGVISGSGSLLKSNSGTTTLSAANTFTGSVTVNGGTLYTNRTANSAANEAFSYVSGITVNSGGTLKAGLNSLFGYNGSNEHPITVNAGGALATDSLGDVGVGLVTLNGGTLASGGANPNNGTWRFDAANDKLSVTGDSTASAVNVRFANGGSIDVAGGKNLNFTGSITNTTNLGASTVIKTGTGTLTLAGANTYTGTTALDAGTSLVNGSLGNTAVTVASAATLGGTGTIGGATTINGTHSPGASPGTQTFGSTLNYGSSARLKWELTSNSVSAGTCDKVNASGAVTVTSGANVDVVLNASGSGVALNDAFWTQSRSWTFLTGSSISGSFALGTISTDPAGRPISNYGTLALQQNANSATLFFTPYTASENWRLANFGTTSNTGNAADYFDPDKDGLSNLLEYALGSDPNNSTASGAPLVSTDTGKLRISFTRNTAATDLTISVMAADDLAADWAEIARSINGAAFTATAVGAAVNESGADNPRTVQATDIYFTSDPAHPKRFMRLEARR